MITFDTFKRGTKKGFDTLIELAKIMIPIYIGIKILDHSGILNHVSNIFKPLMSLLGLPGEASLALVVGYTVNIYAAIGIIASINLSIKQATIIAIMLSIAHNLIAETAITKKLGVKASIIVPLRLVVSLICGYIYYVFF